MTYEQWEQTVSKAITVDSLWKMKAYRLALFAADLGWHDVTKLMRDRRTVGLSDQLYRALGSVSANLAEGYSRGTGKDRARFYEYALGSARESRGWYFKGRHVLSEAVSEHRMQLLNEVIALLLTMIPQQRGRTIREHTTVYQTQPDQNQPDTNEPNETLNNLLRDIPLPKS